MQTISPALQAHFEQQAFKIARLWRITLREGQKLFDGRSVLGFTDWDSSITYDAYDGAGEIEYKSTNSFSLSTVRKSADMSVDQFELMSVFGSDEVREADLRARKYNYAQFHMLMVNPDDLTMGHIARLRAVGGEVRIEDNSFKVEARGLNQYFDVTVGEVTTAACRAQFTDVRCKMPPAATEWDNLHTYAVGDRAGPSAPAGLEFVVTVAGTSDEYEPVWPSTAGDTVVDGTVTWSAYPATQRLVEIDEVTDDRQFKIRFVDPPSQTATISLPNGDAEAATAANWTAFGFGGPILGNNASGSDGVPSQGGTRMMGMLTVASGSGMYYHMPADLNGDWLARVDAGQAAVQASVYARVIRSDSLSHYRLQLEAYDASNALLATLLGSAQYTDIRGAVWHQLTVRDNIPALTRRVRFVVQNQGSDPTPGGIYTLYVDTLTAQLEYDIVQADFYQYGVIECVDPDSLNDGVVVDVRHYTPGARFVDCFQAFPYPVVVGDEYRLQIGCDKTYDRCKQLKNSVNFRGEPFVPGNDAVMDPSADP